jgi:hypothetical protein
MARKLLEDTAIGRMGNKIVTGTTAISVSAGTYYAIQFVTACTPTTFTVDGGTGTYSGITYPAGLVCMFNVTSITAAAGESYILYKA